MKKSKLPSQKPALVTTKPTLQKENKPKKKTKPASAKLKGEVLSDESLVVLSQGSLISSQGSESSSSQESLVSTDSRYSGFVVIVILLCLQLLPFSVRRQFFFSKTVKKNLGPSVKVNLFNISNTFSSASKKIFLLPCRKYLLSRAGHADCIWNTWTMF